MKKFKITIDKTLCIGCGGCTEIDPFAFELDNEGKAMPRSPVFDNSSGKHNKALDAAKSCPVNAITITEVT